ncbi:hypothetical protein OG948_36915 (plasmid) [Embleya sp. NBC_00888]|uniref:hypothetical protein n=1 Tax=Embleya sp. NBC_00888 TaxID=2975960 RepID=UPI002F90B23A|nr:hypothetical protein OG948_36915 [Embleya sp. NBC_00888]
MSRSRREEAQTRRLGRRLRGKRGRRRGHAIHLFWPSIGSLEVLEWRLTEPGRPEAQRLLERVMEALGWNMTLVYGVDLGPREGATFFSQAALLFDRPSGLAVTHGHDDPDPSDPPDSPEYARLHAALAALERQWRHELPPYPTRIALRDVRERREGQLRALFDSFTATHPGLTATIRR